LTRRGGNLVGATLLVKSLALNVRSFSGIRLEAHPRSEKPAELWMGDTLSHVKWQSQTMIRKWVFPIAMLTLATSPVIASDEKKDEQKALADAFAHLDQVTTYHGNDPESSRWTTVGQIVSLAARNRGQLRLAAWSTARNPAEPVYGFTDGEVFTPCQRSHLKQRFRVSGSWLVFDSACVGDARVFTPRNFAALSTLRNAVRRKALLVVEARGWRAEFDVRGWTVAEAVLKVMDVPSSPKGQDEPSPLDRVM